jgi:hypothetical protein
MIKLLKIASTKDMLQFDFSDGKTPTWLDCSAEVKSYASQNLKLGEAVDIVEETRNNKRFVSKISKPGAAPAQTAAPAPAGTQAQPAAGTQTPVTQAPAENKNYDRSPTGKYRDPVTPDEAQSMRRNAIMGHACQLCLCNQTQLPTQPEGLADYATTVYRKLLKAVEEK